MLDIKKMKFPKSIWFFIVTAVVFLLQVVPITGIFLMLLAAPLWSVVLINLGFIGIAFEAVNGQTPRLWLLAPVLWFAGYPAYTLIENSRQQSLLQQFALENAKVHIDFDQSSTDIYWSVDEAFEVSGAATNLLQYHGLRSFYSVLSDKGRAKFKAPTPNRVSFLGSQALCKEIEKRDDARIAQVRTSYMMEVDKTSRYIGFTIRTVCLVSMYENGRRKKIGITTEINPNQKLESDHSNDRIVITDSSGNLHKLNIGKFRIRSWMPLPVMGCFLISGGRNEGWRCDAGFLGGSEMPILTNDNGLNYQGEIVALALGLKITEGIPAISLPELDARARIEESIKTYRIKY